MFPSRPCTTVPGATLRSGLLGYCRSYTSEKTSEGALGDVTNITSTRIRNPKPLETNVHILEIANKIRFITPAPKKPRNFPMQLSFLKQRKTQAIQLTPRDLISKSPISERRASGDSALSIQRRTTSLTKSAESQSVKKLLANNLGQRRLRVRSCN